MIKDILIIGTGLVGTALTKAFCEHDAFNVTIYNRTEAKKAKLSKVYRVATLRELGQASDQFDLIILAVSDDAIGMVSDLLIDVEPEKTIVVHTSGVASIDRLRKHPRHGLFYPLDSFGYEGDYRLRDTPILVDGCDKEIRLALTEVASYLSDHVTTVSEFDRQYLHLAAVWANNFVNTILARSFGILDEHNIDRGLLTKLIRTTMFKALSQGPENSQTGPAKRGDIKSLTQHIALLSDPEIKGLYKGLSVAINPSLKDDIT